MLKTKNNLVISTEMIIFEVGKNRIPRFHPHPCYRCAQKEKVATHHEPPLSLFKHCLLLTFGSVTEMSESSF